MPKMPTPLKWILGITGGLFVLNFLPYILAYGSFILGGLAVIGLGVGFIIWIAVMIHGLGN